MDSSISSTAFFLLLTVQYGEMVQVVLCFSCYFIIILIFLFLLEVVRYIADSLF